MSKKNKAFLVAGIFFGLTLLVTLLRDLETGNIKALWVIYAGFSWNFFAYALDRGMLPQVFVALDGRHKGNPTARTFVFWLTAVLYLAILATMAFADE